MNYITFIKEWAWCLVSPRHAETTWLRIDARLERRIFRNTERVLFTMLGAIIALAIVDAGLLRLRHQINVLQQQQTQVQPAVYVTPTESRI